MQKKVIFGFRLCLYLFALFMILDKFVFTETNAEPIQLNSFTKTKSDTYIDVYFKFEDDKWVTLQTSPLSSKKQTFSAHTIWDENSKIYDYYENKGYSLFGVYINDLKLDKISFFHVSRSIGTMGESVNKKLKILTKKSSATLVFRKIN